MASKAPPGGPAWLVVVAAAGYGKTTALRAAADDRCVAAADLAEQPTWSAVPGVAGPVRSLAVDDLGRLPALAQVRLLRRLAALPAGTRVCVASRRPLGRATRSVLTGRVTERGAADLTLGADTVARLLRDRYGLEDAAAADLAAAVHEVTAGWPALVRLAGEAIRRGEVTGPGELLAALAEPGTEAARWVHEQVLADLPGGPARLARLVDAAVDLDPLTVPLAARLATAGLLPAGGGGAAAAAVGWLLRTGLLVPHARVVDARARGAYRLVPVVAAVVAGGRPPAAPSGRAAGPQRARVIAGWYAAHGYPLAAAQTLHRAGHDGECRELIEHRAEEMLAAGGAGEVARLIAPAADSGPSHRLRLVLGDAVRMSGDVPGALAVLGPLLEAAGPAGPDAGLAWRAGMAHYLRADYAAALAVCDQAPGTGPAVDLALLHTCRSSALAMLGETDQAAAAATRALALARRSGDVRALAAAHTAIGVTAVGARQDDHLAAALAAAERAGDVVQSARVLVNQTDGLLREARYAPALAVAVRALRAAELGGPPGVLVTALHNAGEALTRLGRYDEASRMFERSVRTARRAGLRRTALGLCGLAEVHRQRGRREQSRTAFAEAVDLARETAETQALVPALAGLARLLLDQPGADPDTARALADEAERLAPAPLQATAAVARGWVALRDGDLPLAQQRATAAVRAARAGRTADGLADALELAAAVAADPGAARAALQEVLTIWQRSGAIPAADRVLVLLGRLPGAPAADRSAARAATHRLAGLGVAAQDGSPALPPDTAAAPVRVRVLGGFEVCVGGRPVPLPVWKSRQARTLVKVLVARRGRPVPRGELCELLWPDDRPDRTGHRLSVLLSVVRGVLDPDRVWPADRYLSADLAGISVDLRQVCVDVEVLLRDGAHATELIRAGRPEQAREILAELDRAYGGDAFDDEPYADWADGLREQARACWLRALRDLAELARGAGDTEQAVGCLVRLLAADPFDEPAHRLLVTVLLADGRHGAARRAFDRWTAAMRTVDAPPPDPAVLRGDRRPVPLIRR